MSSSLSRVVSGMRPTGSLHLGHLHGVLKNWVRLQYENECFFFVADWHALTTDYDNTENLQTNIKSMIIDWLSVGINPNKSTVFIQSKIPQHAELHTLFSMITPLSWLERVPTYKDQQEKLTGKDLSTYGFLGYPLLQSADILAYQATKVPVGEDQVAHVELTREVARRFNFLYGRDQRFAQKAESAIKKMGKKNAKIYQKLKLAFQEQGDKEALTTGIALIENQQNINVEDKERLLGFLEGGGKIILPEPMALLTPTAKMPGVDGQKMSKSYNNTIPLNAKLNEVKIKIQKMPTDPARVRRNDKGNPEKCSVWQYHKIYSKPNVQKQIFSDCTTAAIGCVDCKKPIIQSVINELDTIQTNARQYAKDNTLVDHIINNGCAQAEEQAQKTLDKVREAMGLVY